MIEITNTYAGQNFNYTGENCTATGDSRTENEKIVSINVNGQYTKQDRTYSFWANRDAQGNVNVSGVPASVIGEVASEVAVIISEVENPNEE